MRKDDIQTKAKYCPTRSMYDYPVEVRCGINGCEKFASARANC